MRINLIIMTITMTLLVACGPGESSARQPSAGGSIGASKSPDDQSSSDENGDDEEVLIPAVEAADITGAYLTCAPVLDEEGNELFGCGYRNESDDSKVEANCGKWTTLYGLNSSAAETGELETMEVAEGDEPWHMVVRVPVASQSEVVGIRADTETNDAGVISKQTASYLEEDDRWLEELEDYRQAEQEALQAIKDKVGSTQIGLTPP